MIGNATNLEAAVDECLVKVKDQAFLSAKLRRYGGQKPLLGLLGCGHSTGFVASLVCCYSRASSQDSCSGARSSNNTSVRVLVLHLSLGQRRRRRQIYPT
jgi:hypothetical protein